MIKHSCVGGGSFFASGAVALAMLASSAASVQAQSILYQTEFDAPIYTVGPLIGQDGWLITGASVVNPINVNNGSGGPGGVPLTNTGQDVNRLLGTTITAATVPAGASMWLNAVVTVLNAQTAGDYFMHLGDGGASNFNARIYIRAATGGFQMALATGAGAPVYGSGIMPFGQPTLVVARYDFVVGAGNDTGALFVNPFNFYGIGDVPYVAATTIGTDAATISSVNLRQGSATNAPEVYIDNLTVAYLPSPGASALLGLAGLMASRRRRAVAL